MKIAMVSCRNAKHNCAGCADCLRMFYDKIGEFQVYSPDDQVGAVIQCDYCTHKAESFEKHLKAWNNEKNHILHVHLCACMPFCKNYEAIKTYFEEKGFTIGEFRGE